ncbi:hypothetical protein CICLE_v10034011mg [Citrus x clementina]|uniref:WAT1-related protein n=2 Tax=Citrus TaxID=2706 RepID=A0A067CZR9_CITSI|nr:hypothetical protein CICLE_v10034011mg [Citrus x clementina]KDO36013.1 hypothetical protein CISIN_1g033132mg [Citrus sinensis]
MGKVGLAPVIGMMMAECAQVGLMFAGKAAMSDGMSNLVFVFYSNAFASLVLLPASLLFHRSQIPPLTLPILSAFFLLGFLGYAKFYFFDLVAGFFLFDYNKFSCFYSFTCGIYCVTVLVIIKDVVC